MSHNRPWFKFNARDWRADAALRGCSLAARGLWIEMLTLMHEATPYGHLLVQGKPVSDSKLAVMCGIDLDLMGTLIGELEEAGVFSRRAEDGVIFSRRMVRDEAAADAGRKSAVKRWGGDEKALDDDIDAPRQPKGLPNGAANGDPNAKSLDSSDSLLRFSARAQEAGGPGLGQPRDVQAIAVAIEAGCDFDLDILPIVAAKTAKARASPIATWRYFAKAWAEARDARLNPPPSTTKPRNGKHHDRPKPKTNAFVAAALNRAGANAPSDDVIDAEFEVREG